jgi:hypothetical protein
MNPAHEIAGDILAAATALAGLLLVFMGAVSTAYSSYETQQQAAVLAQFRRRAWLAFTGFILSVLAAVCALGAKWFDSAGLASISACLLLAGFLTVVVAALRAVLDVN